MTSAWKFRSKDRPVLLWVTRFKTVPAGQSDPAAVVGRFEPSIQEWKVSPDYLNRPEGLFPTHWRNRRDRPTSRMMDQTTTTRRSRQMAGYRSVAISEDDRAICGDWPQALDRSSSKRILIDGLPLDGGEPIATNACRYFSHLRRGTKSKAANELALVLVVASW